jgi:hypothetical protein
LQMLTRLYLHNIHLSIPLEAYENGNAGNILMGKDEPTTYKLLTESFLVWDETKRIGKGKVGRSEVLLRAWDCGV